jgi:hypothetical protein
MKRFQVAFACLLMIFAIQQEITTKPVACCDRMLKMVTAPFEDRTEAMIEDCTHHELDLESDRIRMDDGGETTTEDVEEETTEEWGDIEVTTPRNICVPCDMK